MSEPSDFPDSFEPEQPFDPTEHFEPLSEGHAEPVFEGIVEDSDAAEKHAAPEPEATADGADWTEPSYAYHHDDAPPFKAPVGRGIAAALLAGAVMVGAGLAFKEVGGIQQAPPAPAAAPAAASPADDSKALAGRVDGLGGTLDGLSKRIDDLQKAIAALPKPAADLKPLEAQLVALGKRIDATPAASDSKGLEAKLVDALKGQEALASQLKSVSDQAAATTKALAAQKTQFAALETKVKSLGTTPAAATTTTAAPASTSDADYAKAVDLFKKGQFGPAKDSFTKLTASSPTDARVWYYAALSSGNSTGDWKGDTEKLVLKGVEQEKAGTPDTAKITAAFADLPAGVKAWLDYYRATAK